MDSLREAKFHLVNRLQFSKEPPVDPRHLPNLLHSVTLMESRSDSKDAFVCWICELLVDVFDNIVLFTASAIAKELMCEDLTLAKPEN